jgi:hypothetical protein
MTTSSTEVNYVSPTMLQQDVNGRFSFESLGFENGRSACFDTHHICLHSNLTVTGQFEITS